MNGIPYERFKWIANTYPPNADFTSQFIEMVCWLSGLRATAVIDVVIVKGPNGPIVVTWQKPAYA